MEDDDDLPELSPLLRKLSLEARAGNISPERKAQIKDMLLSGEPATVRQAVALLPSKNDDFDFLEPDNFLWASEHKSVLMDETLDLQKALSDSVVDSHALPDEFWWGPSMSRQVSFERIPPISELLRQVSDEARAGSISAQQKADMKEKLLSRNPDLVRAAAAALTRPQRSSSLRSRSPDSIFDYLARDEVFGKPDSDGIGDFVFDEAFDFQRALSNSLSGSANREEESFEFQTALEKSVQSSLLGVSPPSRFPSLKPEPRSVFHPIKQEPLSLPLPLPRSSIPPPPGEEDPLFPSRLSPPQNSALLPPLPALPMPTSVVNPFKQFWPGNGEDECKAPADYFMNEYEDEMSMHVNGFSGSGGGGFAHGFSHGYPNECRPSGSQFSSHRVEPFKSGERVSKTCKPFSSGGPSHMASEVDLVIPKYVVPMWSPLRDGQREYAEVRVCTGWGRHGEINLYNSIDLCCGAGMTNSQARVNLTKWRKRHPDMIGARAKMDGRATHQSPYCVPIEAVRSILEQFQKTECLPYFFDGNKERLSPTSAPCPWPTPWWTEQMNQTRLRRTAAKDRDRNGVLANEAE